MVTIKQIAEEVGVSISTASIVLRGDAVKRKVAPKTAERVFMKARELGYKPHIFARQMRISSDAPLVIGIYWSSEFKASMMQFIYGVQEEVQCGDRNIETVIHQYRKGKLKDVLHTLRSCHAAIICNALPEDVQAVREQASAMPVIFYSRDLADFTCVLQNQEEVGACPAKIFAGHNKKRALMLIPEARFQGIDKCMDSFIHNAISGGMSVQQLTAPHSMQGGYDAGKIIAALEPHPDCIFSFSDVLSFGLVKYCRDAGVCVPGELEIISLGNYDSEMEKYAALSLSVMEVPVGRMARECVVQALQSLEDPAEPVRRIIIETPYVARDTCPEGKTVWNS